MRWLKWRLSWGRLQRRWYTHSSPQLRTVFVPAIEWFFGLRRSPWVVGLSGLRHTVEEINDAGLQRILGAHDEEPFSLN